MAAYTGQYKNGLRHGHGTYVYPNGWRYEGEWSSGLKHGHGTLHLGMFGGTLEADFSKGEATCSHGVRVWRDGSRYEGPFELGEAHGERGEYRGADGESYVGGWHKNKYHGPHGVHVSASGDSYEGAFSMHAKHGTGKLVRADGSSYEGEWSHNMREGRGIDKMASGEVVFEGEWRADKPHGYGRRACPFSSYIYEGEFADGEPADPPTKLEFRPFAPEHTPAPDLVAALAAMSDPSPASGTMGFGSFLGGSSAISLGPMPALQGTLGSPLPDIFVEVKSERGMPVEGESGRTLILTISYVGPLPVPSAMSRGAKRVSKDPTANTRLNATFTQAANAVAQLFVESNRMQRESHANGVLSATRAVRSFIARQSATGASVPASALIDLLTALESDATRSLHDAPQQQRTVGVVTVQPPPVPPPVVGPAPARSSSTPLIQTSREGGFQGEFAAAVGARDAQELVNGPRKRNADGPPPCEDLDMEVVDFKRMRLADDGL
eukprot:m51a1_g101 hypothetical protein (495) ;mRNA; r:318350-320582